MSKYKRTKVTIQGMHCPSCEVLITDKFSEVHQVKSVNANYQTQEALVEYSGDELNKDALNKRIEQYGYRIVSHNTVTNEPFINRLFDFSALLFGLLFIFFLLSQFNLLPNFNAINSLSYGAALLLGVVASFSTCMATTGALFLSTIGKLNPKEHGDHPLVPAISFVVGRVLSYGVFGYLLGYIGKSVSTNWEFGGILTLVVSVLMLLIGLDMAKVFSIQALLPRWSGNLFLKMEQPMKKNPRGFAFLLGVITYFLPCGFTQTVQVYALGLADPVKSGLTLFLFALGSVPVLLSLAFAASFTESKWYGLFQKTMGVVIVLIGVLYFSNFLTLNGVVVGIQNTAQKNIDNTGVTIENGVQIVRMKVNGYGYTPDTFEIKKGIPVKWIIDGENVYGCQGALLSPKIQVRTVLNPGENVIEFTPQEAGIVPFSCSMGMYRGQFTVIG